MGKSLVFSLGLQEFSVQISAVKEIKEWSKATAFPAAPSFVEGVVNVRGAVIPLVDMGQMIGVSSDNNEKKAIIFLRNETKVIGFSVTNVTDISDMDDTHFRDLPELSSENLKYFSNGIQSLGERMIFSVNVSSLFEGSLQ
ncbi:chemotaxis protein CheW [Gluconobacter kanchanaburiensis]|uniref:Chemotaxis protein CheW n=1 Tax=Gluconobacter kanchanaburiensis NBRC 103587 TaxID=1307948 RepID=A0A511B8I3_9PROT|nr:chemotaxis protein CheW [Gluconobacter kanchanaburiensis]MBF0861054.1 purine-binding chemotaxis protein CheW [Gluconobacter kanchanaburiensis]GBR70295.1 chemotaxis protein CheW [Gluconobacter kanchanaburiensis NBRC 103587]GEK96750.1 chemotaxis protein CheW [Gluconobacter kanchanaburiensis NBRC 103587]